MEAEANEIRGAVIDVQQRSSSNSSTPRTRPANPLPPRRTRRTRRPPPLPLASPASTPRRFAPRPVGVRDRGPSRAASAPPCVEPEAAMLRRCFGRSPASKAPARSPPSPSLPAPPSQFHASFLLCPPGSEYVPCAPRSVPDGSSPSRPPPTPPLPSLPLPLPSPCLARGGACLPVCSVCPSSRDRRHRRSTSAPRSFLPPGGRWSAVRPRRVVPLDAPSRQGEARPPQAHGRLARALASLAFLLRDHLQPATLLLPHRDVCTLATCVPWARVVSPPRRRSHHRDVMGLGTTPRHRRATVSLVPWTTSVRGR